jgi:hypothetical protein
MDKKTAERDRFDWRLALYVSIGALILFVPVMIYGIDIGQMLYLFVAVPTVSLLLLIVALRKKGRRRLAVLSMLLIYWAVSWGLFRNSRELRTAARWLLSTKDYKAKVLAEPDSANGALKHIEWDGWGFPGLVTPLYILFSTRTTHFGRRRGTVPRENSAAYPAKFMVFAVWTAIIISFYSIPTRIGPTAIRACMDVICCDNVVPLRVPLRKVPNLPASGLLNVQPGFTSDAFLSGGCPCSSDSLPMLTAQVR